MSESGTDAPLLGVVVSPLRIDAQRIDLTPFGRLRCSGTRLTESVAEQARFTPAVVQRQAADAELTPEEARAADAWLQSIANVIAKLTFDARGGAIRLGLALDARLDAPGRRVLAARGGPRVEDLVEALEGALRDRGIGLIAPLQSAIPLVEALALGEIWSPLGGLAGGIDGVVVMWDQNVGWADVVRGEVVRRSVELPMSGLDLGLARLDQRRAERSGAVRPIATGARHGDEDARALLRETAESLGRAAARRLLTQLSKDADRGVSPGKSLSALRVVLAGDCARFAADPRLEDCVRTPFVVGLAKGLRDREDAAMEAGLLERDEDGQVRIAPGALHVSHGESAAVIGAAASALRDVLPPDKVGDWTEGDES